MADHHEPNWRNESSPVLQRQHPLGWEYHHHTPPPLIAVLLAEFSRRQEIQNTELPHQESVALRIFRREPQQHA